MKTSIGPFAPLARSISSRTLLSRPASSVDGEAADLGGDPLCPGELAVGDDDRARALVGDAAHERPPDAAGASRDDDVAV